MAASQRERGRSGCWHQLPVLFVLCVLSQLLAAAAAHAQWQGARYANAFVERPLVQPSMSWAFDGALNVTSLPAGKPLITAPNLGTRIGVPSVSIIPAGLEAGASVLPLVLSPNPPALAYSFSGYLMQRLLPWPRLPVETRSHETLELALRLQLGTEQVLPDFTFHGLQFAVSAGVPLLLRAADVLRFDLAPTIILYAGLGRGAFVVPVTASVQASEHVWLGVTSGIAVPDTAHWSVSQIALGVQLAATIANTLGPVLDIVVDAGFPRLWNTGHKADVVDVDTFRALLSFRFYTYWDLSATLQVADPNSDPTCARPQ
jgi:hypothetical protein